MNPFKVKCSSTQANGIWDRSTSYQGKVQKSTSASTILYFYKDISAL